jgi:hypothetical protein
MHWDATSAIGQVIGALDLVIGLNGARADIESPRC